MARLVLNQMMHDRGKEQASPDLDLMFLTNLYCCHCLPFFVNLRLEAGRISQREGK